MIPEFRAWDKYEESLTDQDGIYFGAMDHDGTLESLMLCLEERYVLMQSTGLKDKNGVDVYQGDIIRCTSGCPHEVIWLEEYGGTFFGGMPAWYLSGLSNGYAWTGREEVIGNIYENSDLVEVD